MQVTTLVTDGYVTIPYPQSLRVRVHEAMQSWKNFCALPIEEKRKLSGGDRVSDFGYMRREDTGPRVDDKELFHVVKNEMSRLHTKVVTVSDQRAVRFIDAVETLRKESAPFIQEFAQAVEQEYQLNGLEEAVANSQHNWTFRYLHYFPGKRPSLANAHADRGGFTFHLWEDHVGGEYFDFDREWHPWSVSETKTIIFPSMGLQYFSHCALKALWHRIVPNKITETTGRYSMVAFIDFNMSHRFDDNQYRMQNFEPGFNYNMPFRDFKKLFVPR